MTSPVNPTVFSLPDGVNFTHLQYPGAEAQTYAYGLSQAGQVVGYFHAADNIDHGFLFDGTTYTLIDVPGATETFVRAISPDGTKLVGTWNDGVSVYAFLATSQIDQTPPVITATATPATLRPPNGKLIPVIVSGTILDSGVGVDPSTATFEVLDEYGLIAPSGPITREHDGSYTFTVALQASRRGSDPEGRHYTIMVSATDTAGNPGSASATVTVPRN